MIELIRKYDRLLKQDIYRGKLKENNMRVIGIVGLLIAVCTAVTTIMNFCQHKAIMGVTTSILCAAGIFAYFTTSKLHKRKPAAVLFTLLCVVIFTYYTVIGTNEGFATLWTVAVPIAIMYLIGVRYGIALGLYYLGLYIALFYTPLQRFMEGIYTQSFIQRFPILYTFTLLMESVSMIQYHVITLEQFDYDERLHEEVDRLTASETRRRMQLEKMYDQMVHTLVNAIDAKDKYTNGHSERVSAYSVALAQKLGWPEEEITFLRYEALLHDVGKIAIPDTLLNKPGKLSDVEYRIIQSHTTAGAEILSAATTLPGARDVALHHHERYDGAGYPDHIAGDKISTHARVVSIMDSYDAMNSDRIYRNAIPTDEIRAEMQQGRGKQFDPVYLDIFMELLADGSLDRIAEQCMVSNDVPRNPIAAADIRSLQDLIGNLKLNGKYEGAAGLPNDELPKFYEYISNFCRRYRHTFELVMITIRPVSGGDDSPERRGKALRSMEIAVKKTIRQADVISRISDSQLLIILVEAHVENVDGIMFRIFTNFYKLYGGSEYEPSYETKSFNGTD
jgi:putative nucleotidyltransferase with HDIG domain